MLCVSLDGLDRVACAVVLVDRLSLFWTYAEASLIARDQSNSFVSVLTALVHMGPHGKILPIRTETTSLNACAQNMDNLASQLHHTSGNSSQW